MNKLHMKPLVTMCIPFSRKVLPEWAISLASIVPPMNGTLNIDRTKNMPRDQARDYLVDGALQHESKFTFFLDDDVTVPPNILREMLFQIENADDDVMVIGGIYCTKTSPAMPLVYKTIGDGPFYKWKLGQVFPCELIATGMMLIRNEVFKHIQKPWFREVHTVEEGKSYGLIPEDFNVLNYGINDDGFFCHKVREAGFKILAHGGMLGMHWDDEGRAYCLPDDTYPMQSEMHKRYATPPKDQADYIRRVMETYKKAYGYIDLLPMDKDLAAISMGS